MKYLFLLLFSVSAFAARYTHPQHGFSFEFDDTKWEVVPEQDKKTPAADVDKKMAEKTLVTIQHKQAEEKYRARFSVVVDTKDLSFSLYHKHALDFLKSQRFHIVSTEERKIPGLDLPTAEIIANQRDFGLTFRQVIFLKDKEAYLLTAATRTKSFDSLKLETNRFFDTFTFSKGSSK